LNNSRQSPVIKNVHVNKIFFHDIDKFISTSPPKEIPKEIFPEETKAEPRQINVNYFIFQGDCEENMKKIDSILNNNIKQEACSSVENSITATLNHSNSMQSSQESISEELSEYPSSQESKENIDKGKENYDPEFFSEKDLSYPEYIKGKSKAKNKQKRLPKVKKLQQKFEENYKNLLDDSKFLTEHGSSQEFDSHDGGYFSSQNSEETPVAKRTRARKNKK